MYVNILYKNYLELLMRHWQKIVGIFFTRQHSNADVRY